MTRRTSARPPEPAPGVRPPQSSTPGAEIERSGGSEGRGFEVAYAFLNRRERTVAEMRLRLERAEVEARETEAVVAELIELGYLDDARYARIFTEDRRTLDSWGDERISRALRERGIERDLVDAALLEERPGQELARALALLQARFGAGPVQERDRQRAFGVLARRGYSSGTAGDAVREWARQSAP